MNVVILLESRRIRVLKHRLSAVVARSEGYVSCILRISPLSGSLHIGLSEISA